MDRLRPALTRSRIPNVLSRPPAFTGLRVSSWRGDERTALVGPRRDGRRPSPFDVMQCIERLQRSAIHTAVTPALNHHDAQAFLEAGFSLHENLHLLACVLSEAPEAPTLPIRFGRPWHQREVLRIDQAAFEPFWQFDRHSLYEARNATPTARYRVAFHEGQIVGYAVTGRAGDRGYLQRLAVDPERFGLGIGTALINDAFRWLYRRGAHQVLVNTQEHNLRALSLYRHVGFVSQEPGLVVLRWEAPS